MRKPRVDGSPALTDVAVQKIKQMIISGELAPGQRLPREADFADRLGLSRSSLREAVKGLSMLGVLDVRQGDGTYVASLDSVMLLGGMAFVVDFHRDDEVLHFLEVRRILEPAASEMACVRLTDAEIDELDAHLDRLGEDPSVEELVASDLEFHKMIVAGSGNPVLTSLLDSIAGPIQRARLWRGSTEAHALARTTAEHRAIVRALRARMPAVVSAAVTTHIFGVEQWLRSASPELRRQLQLTARP
ncbi:FadR/GntR family transcriptional regulator [Microlunatus soli]|nr:FadR/GntR family transcriptional regulator [Microlunatus soli]